MIQEFQHYLNTHRIKKLQVGAGGNVLPGWLNTDLNPNVPGVYRLDIICETPFEDNTFNYVFSEHMIEHVSYVDGQKMLSECYRILQPGGLIRISCPDLNRLLKLYTNPNELENDYISWAIASSTPWAPWHDGIFVLNNFVRDWGHKFIYNQKTLARSLANAGFKEITYHAIRESQYPELENLEIESRMPPGFLQIETMTLQGVKL